MNKKKGFIKEAPEEKLIGLERIREDLKKVGLDPEEGTTTTEIKRGKMFSSRKKTLKLSFWDKRKLRTKPQYSYIITMYFANGTSKTFVRATNKNTFKYKGKLYYLDYTEAWYDLSLRSYHFYYNEKYAVPINREVEQKGDEAYFNVRPENLKSIIAFKYVEALAGSGKLDKILIILMVISFINLIISAIVALSLFNIGK